MTCSKETRDGAKRYNPEEIISKLREVEILLAEGIGVGKVVRRLGVTQVTYDLGLGCHSQTTSNIRIE